MKIIVSNEAKQNMDNIFEYIAKDSIKYAIETDKNIRSYIHKLEGSPHLGRYIPELDDKKYRELIYKSYRIVYEVSEENETVYIHFLVHGKRDFKSFYNFYFKIN